MSVVFLAFFISIVMGAKWISNSAMGTESSVAALSGLFSNISSVVNYDKTISADENNISQFPYKNQQVEESNIGAQSAISVWTNLSNEGKIVFDKNSQEKLPIASISKLMTALVAVENLDLSKEIKISGVAANQSKDPEPLKEGEIFYVKDLLYTMLIGSNNAASFAFSESIGTDKFIGLMNQKAKDLGLQNTSFANPIGFGSENFSTAGDLAKLAEYILRARPSIFGITTMREFDLYTVDGQILHKITNTDKLLNDTPDLAERVIGGKTGETPFAGGCLLSVVRALDGQGYLISVVLNTSNRFEETKKLVDWVDKSYQWKVTAKKETIKITPVTVTFDPIELTWEEAVSSAPWEARDSQAVAVYNGKIWLMGGLNANKNVISQGKIDYDNSKYFSDVWLSEDGANWIKVADKSPWGDRRSMTVVDFKGKMWLMGGWGPTIGYNSDIWSSENGADWKLETEAAAWPAREGHQLLVFQNKIWLIGGVRYDKQQLFNDVWYSEDGVNWVEATDNAGWSPRWDHAVGVFDNKLWLIDGMVFGGRMFKDIWSSADGVNWILATATPPFKARQGNFITGYKGKLWVIGRLDAAMNGGVNDVWYSDDGISWQKTKNNPLWLGREDFGAVVFNDMIWIIGGMDRNWEWVNNVWHSTF